MAIFLTIIHVIVCFVLILVILLQAGKGQGLGSSFGGGNVQSVLGTKAADFLTKATTVAAICFIVTCIGLSIIEASKSKSLMELSEKAAPVNVEQIKEALERAKKEMEASNASDEAKQAVNALTEKIEAKAADMQSEASTIVEEAKTEVAAGEAAVKELAE